MKTNPFPIGAWVRDPMMRRLTQGIERDPISGGVKFVPFAGEIVGTGEICKVPVYRIQFADSLGFVVIKGAECYQCHSVDDDSHLDGCPDKILRQRPHAPGFC